MATAEDEGGKIKEGEATHEAPPPPGSGSGRNTPYQYRKRALALTAFASCLTFLLIVIQMAFTALHRLMDNRTVWEELLPALLTNYTSTSYLALIPKNAPMGMNAENIPPEYTDVVEGK